MSDWDSPGRKEFAEEAAQALEKARVVGVHALESSGNAASGLQTSATSKGGQLMLHGGRYSQYALPRDSNIIKGDTVLLQRPPAESHSGPLHSDPRWGANGGGPPANEESEAEVLSVFPQFTVKVMGAASLESVQRLCGIRVNVFRLTNKVTFTRKLDALRAVLEDGGSGGKGQASMDAALRGIVCAGFGCATTDERDAQTAAVPQMCSSPPSGTAPFAVGSAAGEVHRKENLNASQRNALLAGISQRLTLVQGPPGTGKTHTAISLISLWLRSGQGPVLATSDSNIAVDNLVGGLAAAGMAVVRVGRPESVRSDLLPHMLESQAARQADRSDREAFHHAQVAALRRAQVVCATCSGAGSEMLGKLTFPSVLLDEASQATEPSTLVPLVRGARQVALVGDHCQLPPTIISRDAELGGLNVSLFDHLVAAGVHPHLLDTQYRMHPALAAFPSKAFYSGMLRSGVEPAARKAPRGFHWPVEGAPLAFVPCSHGWERKDGSSYENHAEAEEVARIVQNFLAAGELTEGDIGIVTPYAGQVRVLRRILRVPRGADQPGVPRLEVSSVDGFQGREKELIVFSAVRSNLSGAVGFLADARRVNVMLTRARRGLVVVGSEATLSQEPTVWGPWLAWASACGLVAGRAATDPAAAAAVHAGDWAGATANVPAVWMRHGSVPTRDAEHVQAAPCRSIVGSHSSSNLVMSSYSAL